MEKNPSKAAAPAPAPAVCEEFEPFCKWQRGEDRDILEVQLQDFKKDELRVQISNHGILKISGERQVDPSKKSKFYKEVPASRNSYDTSSILARFVSGCLYITMPKKKSVPDPTGVPLNPPPAAETPAAEKPIKPEPTPEIEENLKPDPATPKLDNRFPKPKAPEEDGVAWKECVGRNRSVKVAATLAATAAAMAVLVAYVIYIYKSTVGESEEA